MTAVLLVGVLVLAILLLRRAYGGAVRPTRRIKISSLEWKRSSLHDRFHAGSDFETSRTKKELERLHRANASVPKTPPA